MKGPCISTRQVAPYAGLGELYGDADLLPCRKSREPLLMAENVPETPGGVHGSLVPFPLTQRTPSPSWAHLLIALAAREPRLGRPLPQLPLISRRVYADRRKLAGCARGDGLTVPR